MVRRFVSGFAFVLGLSVAAAPLACASGNYVRPSLPSAAQSLGEEACPLAADHGRPLVVDWPADRRGEIELALKEKPIVVAYDCHGLRILSDCEVNGSYAFAGTTQREQVLSFETADEVSANLPFSGAVIAGKLGAGLARGSTLDLALATIGRRTTPRRQLAKTELRGACEGATHFVRAATVGAFAMRAGAKGHVATAASLFGIGVNAARSEGAFAESRDGSLEACRRSRPDALTAEAQCGAPLRLELRALSAVPAGPVAAPTADDLAVACAPGLVASDSGECRAPSERLPHVCVPNDASDCEAQCSRGSMASCAILGRSYETGRGVKKDLARAVALLGKACTARVAAACSRVGELMLFVLEDERGLAMLDLACRDGWFEACSTAGSYALKQQQRQGPGQARTKVDVTMLFRRSCAGGDAEGCWSLGQLFEVGLGVPQDDRSARRLYGLACEGGAKLGCVSLAAMVDEGRGGAPDPKSAFETLGDACRRGFADACGSVSSYFFLGKVVPRDAAQGIALLDRACQNGARGNCHVLGMRYHSGVGVKADPTIANRYFTQACEGGVTPACAMVQKPARSTDRP